MSLFLTSCWDNKSKGDMIDSIIQSDSTIVVWKDPNIAIVTQNIHKSFATFYDDNNSELLMGWRINDTINEEGVYKVLYKYGKYDFHVVEIKEGHWGRYKVYKLEKDNYVELDEVWQPKVPEQRIEIEKNENMEQYYDGNLIATGIRVKNSFIDSMFQIEINAPWMDTISGIGDSTHILKI